MRQLAVLLCLFCMVFTSLAQNDSTSPIIFIYDASGSMWGQMDGKTKMEIASNVLSTSVEKLGQNQQIGLVAYGHRKKGDCKDVETLVNMENSSKSAISSALKNVKPLGKTPLAYSAELVISDLRKSKQKATIILITDGIESCNGNICDVVKAARAEGIDFLMNIVGFGLKKGETEQLICAAKEGGGQYYDAADAGALGDVLTEATQQTVDMPAGNVSVYATKNGEPIDAYVKAYDQIAKRKPIAVRTYKDTGYVYLPPSTYTLEVNPLEGSDVEKILVANVESFEDKVVHRDVSFDGGKLGITTTNNGENWDCTVKLKDSYGKTAASVRTYSTPKEAEVNPGTYTVTIQALSMKGLETYTEIENVLIEAGKTTPISYNFETGEAFVDATADGKSIDSVVTIKEANSGKSVDGGRTYTRGAKFLLNPGNYNVKVAPIGAYKDRAAQTFTMEVKRGELTSKKLTF